MPRQPGGKALGPILQKEMTTLESPVAEPPSVADRLPRRLGDFGSPEFGPTVLVFAGVHGNEPAGVLAVRQILPMLRDVAEDLRGRIVLLSGNRQALIEGQRFIDLDLNRCWTPKELWVAKVEHSGARREDAEIRELDAELEELEAEAGNQEIFALDLHTTSGPGPAFTVLDDTLPNRELARSLQVPMVLGIEEELSGTLAHHLAEHGVPAVTFEGGQHQDPLSVDHCAAAIWILLGSTGLLDPATNPMVLAAKTMLAAAAKGLPKAVEVRFRQAIESGDEFKMEPGFVNFQAVEAGALLAHDRNGPIAPLLDGLILMPLYQRLGGDGFFLVHPVDIRWLALSERLRRFRLERFVHWMPGVRRHPERPGAFLVNRSVARFYALQVFHLLGFRRSGPVSHTLTMIRRRFDH